MVYCCIKNCKSRWKRNSVINLYRFPFSNEKIIKYWIAATGRNNWIPYPGARICSLHFTHNDYYNDTEHNYCIETRLKPDAIPTQHVHASILQVFQQDSGLKINEYNQNNDIVSEEHKLTNKLNKNISAISECSNCSNCNKLLIENERLRKEIEDLKILQKKRLNQQASMFHTIIHNKEAVLKEKLEIAKNKNKNLNRSIRRTGKDIINLKTLLKDVERKNISGNNA